jgi:sugar (pentulose or hexulose) kinase
MDACVGAFDLGKTNIKLVVFDSSENALAESARVNAPLDEHTSILFAHPSAPTAIAWTTCRLIPSCAAAGRSCATSCPQIPTGARSPLS